MATTKVSDGNVIPHTAGATIASADLVEFGADATGFTGVALDAIVNTEEGPVDVTGVYKVAKKNGASTGGSQGDRVYWNAATKEATAVAGTDHLMGYFWKTAGDNDVTCQVKMGG